VKSTPRIWVKNFNQHADEEMTIGIPGFFMEADSEFLRAEGAFGGDVSPNAQEPVGRLSSAKIYQAFSKCLCLIF
jgi:hypothetical protein